MLLTLLQSGSVMTVTGTGAITLDSVSVDGAGTSTIQASGSISLASVSVAGAGSSTIQGSGAVALDSVSVAGAGNPVVAASSAVTLDAVAVSGLGTPTIQGTGAVTLGSVSIAGVGDVLPFVLPGPVVGQLACVSPSLGGLVLTTPGTAALACVAPSFEDLVCTVASAASLACVVRNVWAFPAVSFTRSRAVTFREAGTPYANLGATIVDVPWCGVEGDLILLAVTVRGVGTFTTPAGWSMVALVEVSFCRTAVFSRVKAPGDVGNVAVTVDATISETTIGQMFAFAGASTVTAGAPFTSTTSNATIGPVPGVTAANGDVVVAIGARSNDWVTISTLSGDGLAWQQAAAVTTTIGGDAGQVVDLAECASAVTVADKTWTATGTTAAVKVGIMLVVSP